MPIHRRTQPPGRRRTPCPLRSLTACAVTVVLVATGSVAANAGSSIATGTSPVNVVTDITPHQVAPATSINGHYIVTMRDQPAASYDGTLHGLARTKADPGVRLDMESDSVRRYTDHLTRRHREAAAAVGATITSDYAVTSNGFSASLTADQVTKLSNNPDVLSVDPDAVMHPTSTPTTRYLGLEGAHGLWAAAGGKEGAGKGTVIGVLDYGISPHNPSFAGAPLGTTPGDAPYRDGSAIVFRKADGTMFRSACETGPGFSENDCSTKIVGARMFIAGFESWSHVGPTERRSPLDTDGHGSHTTSTAAGNADVPAVVAGRVLDTISGMAPAAKVVPYKVCWNGVDEDHTACMTSDIDAGIEQATIDGVDVINMSLGGGADQAPMQRALFGAASAGVFITTSAGNSGPDAGTVEHSEPWVTTVAATYTPNNYSATLTLGDGRRFAGGSVTVSSTVSGPLVLASASGVKGTKHPQLCGKGALDPNLVRGRIVECDTSNDAAPTDESAEVKRAGGIGMLLVSTAPYLQEFDAHSVPTINLDTDVRQAILDYAGKQGATATLTPGDTSGVANPAPRVADISSRGPSPDAGSNVVKPDIAAPGVHIIAAVADKDGNPQFGANSGTSRASPHIAGFALVYLGLHPQASPAEVKSALMTTATDTVDTKGNRVTNPFVQGAGEIAPDRYLHPGLAYLSGPQDWAGYAATVGLSLPHPAAPIAVSQLNLPSIAVGSLDGGTTVTRSVTSQGAGTWKASVQGVDGVDVKIFPSTLRFTAAGQTQTFQVKLTEKNGAKPGVWATGSLTWTGTANQGTVRSPIAVQPRR